MTREKIRLLSTRPLPQKVKDFGAAKGIELCELSFIETVSIANPVLQDQVRAVAAKPATVVFTSMQAVLAVAHLLDQAVLPAWHVACMGHTTRQLVGKLLPQCNIVATGSSAADLAQGVAEAGAHGMVHFFCGNQRRPELPQALQAAGLTVQEHVVYTTHAVPHKLDSFFNGILFFSPSAVRSFFAANSVSRHTVLFAIGQTTARELGMHCSNKVVTGHQTSKHQLALMAIDYFAGQNSH